MKRILCACALLSIAAFADTHPALKEAIDSKNYKQAENLIKNVGVKDIYCPETLAAKDADKIYGKIFTDSIGYLLENCDVVFSRTYLEYKCAGGKDKAMCLNLVNLTDPYSWPETYAKQFCTKKNVEICAAAIEKIPVEKSVPFLKAIKTNKLAEMKQINIKDFRSGCATKKECLPQAKELYNDMLAQIQRRIDDANFNWRMARNDNERYNREKEIKRWEEEKKELKAKGYSNFCSDLQNDITFEKLKLNQYYFDTPFMLLTDKAARYYWDIHNPIIPGLAENWADVDRLFEIANKATIKSIESMKDTLARLTALAQFMEKYAKLAPYFIYKKNIIDNMKESFAKNEKIDPIEQLFYCKLYPSLDKEVEKLFGMKIIDCKAMLEENKKIAEPCEGDSRLFGEKVHCVEGKFEKSHWLKVNRFFVINDFDYQISSKDAENLPGMLNFIKHGRLYSWEAGMKACPDGSRIPNESEMKLIAKDGSNLITPSKAGYLFDGNLKNLGSKTVYMTLDRYNVVNYGFGDNWTKERGGDWLSAATIDSTGKWNLDIKYKLLRETRNKKESVDLRTSLLCISEELENEKCSEDQEGQCYASNCCENGSFKKRVMDRMVDMRDGREYTTVQIGKQIWMAENLNHQIGKSHCYEKEAANCDIFGRLYSWDDAQKACPEGWHLPNVEEFKDLSNFFGGETTAGKFLKSHSGWNNSGNGTVIDGFSAQPGGYFAYIGNSYVYRGKGDYAIFWTSSEVSKGTARSVDLSHHSTGLGIAENSKDADVSVRCIKD